MVMATYEDSPTRSCDDEGNIQRISSISTAKVSPNDMLPAVVADNNTVTGRRGSTQPGVDNGDVVIIRSEDDISLVTSRSLLCQHSTFFAGLLSLPNATAQIPIIDLPSATSDGLALVLKVLKSGQDTPRWSDICIWDDLALLAEALAIADLYDFSDFVHLFSPIRAVDHGPRPILTFAIAAMMHDLDDLRGLALKSLRADPVSMPAEDFDVLRRTFSEAHNRLIDLRRRYFANVSYIECGLQHEPMLNRIDDFSQRCLGFKGWAGPCEACGQYGWWELSHIAAERVKQAILAADLHEDSPDIRAIVQEVVPCHRCTTRLVQVFARIVRSLWSSGSRW